MRAATRVHSVGRSAKAARTRRPVDTAPSPPVPRPANGRAGGSVDTAAEGGAGARPEGGNGSANRPCQIPAGGGIAPAVVRPPAVGHDSGGMGAQPNPPVPAAPLLPLTNLGTNARSVLATVAPQACAVVFSNVNALNRIGALAEKAQDYDRAAQAYQFAARIALKTVEITVGKQVNVTAQIRNQTDVPRLTFEQQQALVDGFTKAGISVDEYVDAVIVGEQAPQTSEDAYRVAGPDETPSGATSA